ncbi:MAG: hypothetical protein ACM3NO_04850, partial [Deltaproteobacteria bacterium]
AKPLNPPNRTSLWVLRSYAMEAPERAGGAIWAQMGRGGMGMRPPQIPGTFAPKVGEGAEYQITSKQGNMDMEYAVVGKETVDGQEGYWQEIRMKSGQGTGVIMKQLMVVGGSNPGIKRMIMQPPGQEPMEMPMNMMGGMMQQHMQQQAAERAAGSMGEKVGTETITVPAGTFECDHYRSKDNDGDVWISSKVYPYGLIKAVTKDTTFVLQKTLTGQTSQIKGEPKKLEMPHF